MLFSITAHFCGILQAVNMARTKRTARKHPPAPRKSPVHPPTDSDHSSDVVSCPPTPNISDSPAASPPHNLDTVPVFDDFLDDVVSSSTPTGSASTPDTPPSRPAAPSKPISINDVQPSTSSQQRPTTGGKYPRATFPAYNPSAVGYSSPESTTQSPPPRPRDKRPQHGGKEPRTFTKTAPYNPATRPPLTKATKGSDKTRKKRKSIVFRYDKSKKPSMPKLVGKNGKVKRTAPSLMAIREIEYFRRSCHLLIPQAPFRRYVRQITEEDVKKFGIRWQSAALNNLQLAAEEFLTQVLEDGMFCAYHCGRVTLKPRDLFLARWLRGEVNKATYNETLNKYRSTN